jgi:methyltransferase (TIGR00027 family)
MALPLKSYIEHLGFSLKGLIYAVIVTVAFVQAERLALPGELEKPSWTAENNAAYRAIAALDPDHAIRNPDYLAEKFVSSEFWGSSYLSPDFRASKKVIDSYGLAGYYTINARTKHMDTLLRKALEDGARQVVILGAGYDSRAYRFQDASPGVTFFEVDLPITQAEKRDA